MRRAAAAAVLTLAVAAPARGGDDAVTIRPHEGLVWGDVPVDRVLFLVRDARTRRPVAGAVVRRHLELVMGDDAAWAPPCGEGRTDAHGLFAFDCSRTPEGGETSHWSVDAPGYGVTEVYGGAGAWEVIDLEPSRDVHGVLLDARGAPARGILVEWKVGCAHAPALRVGRTDATGRFVLRGLADPDDGEVCWEGPGVLADYAPRSAVGPVGHPPPVTVAGTAVTVRGRIVNAAPGRLDRAVVRGIGTHERGPLARVARDGTFVMEGAGPGDGWTLEGIAPPRVVLDLDDVRPDAPVVWDLGPERPEPEPVDVRVVEQWVGGKPEALVEPVRVAFDGVADGRRRIVELSVMHRVHERTASLPPGTYDVSVSAERLRDAPFVAYTTPRQRVVVPAPPAAPPVVTLGLAPQPRLQVTWVAPPDPEARFVLSIPGGERTFDADDEVSLPAEVEAFVRPAGTARFARVGPAADGARPVTVDPRPTAVLAFVGLDDDDVVELDGQPWSGGLEPAGHEARLAWPGRPGPHAVRVRLRAGGVAATTVDVPEGPGTVVRVDVATLPRLPAGRLELVGFPADGAAVAVTTFDDDGAPVKLEVAPGSTTVEHPALTAGRVVRILRADDREVVRRLEGSSPFRVRCGTATLRLRVPAGAGGTVAPRIQHVGGEPEVAWAPAGGWAGADRDRSPRGDAVATLRALDAGEHTFLVGAFPALGRVEVRVRLAEGEDREVVVPLPPR